MASHGHDAAGAGVKSFARLLGQTDDGSITFEEAIALTDGQKLVPTTGLKPVVVRRPNGVMSPGDLPMDFMAGTKIHSFMGVIQDVDLVDAANAPYEFEAFEEHMRKGQYKQLPPPLRSKSNILVPYTMQVFIVDQENNKKMVIKHITFEGDTKVNVAQCEAMCFGLCMKLNYGTQSRNGARALQHLLENLGGWQARYWTLISNGTKKASKDSDSLKEGFAHIKKWGPRSLVGNKITEWAETQVVTPESKVYGWSVGLVKESLCNYAKGNNLAKTIDYYPLTARSIAGWFFNLILVRLLNNMFTNSVIWLGKAARGKSPMAYILSMLFSRFYIRRDGLEDNDDYRPGFRTASNLDFFRGEPGTLYIPCVFDDGPLHKQPAEKVKAFTDMTCEDAATFERWGSATWDMNSLRQSIANMINLKAEDKFHVITVCGKTHTEEISHDDFVKLIKPSFKDCDEEDMEAIFKRAEFVVLTDNYIYYRPHEQAKVNVERHAYPEGKKDLLSDACKPTIAAYKRGSRKQPKDYETDMEWSLELLHRVQQGESVPKVKILQPSIGIFGKQIPLQEIYPSFKDSVPTTGPANAQSSSSGSSSSRAGGLIEIKAIEDRYRSIKRERSEDFAERARAAALRYRGETIEVDDVEEQCSDDRGWYLSHVHSRIAEDLAGEAIDAEMESAWDEGLLTLDIETDGRKRGAVNAEFDEEAFGVALELGMDD